MKAIDQLIKYLGMKNIAEDIDDDKLNQIAQDVITGTRIDEDSMAEWVELNKQAIAIIKNCEKDTAGGGLYEGQSKIIYPLLVQAIPQLAARTISHVVRNNRTVEIAVLGKDVQVPNEEIIQQAVLQYKQQVQQFQAKQQSPQQPAGQQSQGAPQQQGQQSQMPQPPQIGQIPGALMWKKKSQAQRVSDFLNYKLLIESKTWLINEHKYNTLVAGWGTAFKRVYFDPITKENVSDILHPENVIINHGVHCLDDAPRVTIKHYLTRNQLIENIRSGYFLDIDLDTLFSDSADQDGILSDSEELQPVHTILCQTCYVDLDEDDYAEPYKVYVHAKSKKTLGIVPAFEFDDILIDEDSKGTIWKIQRRLDVVDRHLMDDPDGKYFSVGLNSLLLHQNKAITSTLRQLMDAGTLSNASAVSGFVTKAFKTKERDIKIKLGSFHVLDCNPSVDPTKQVMNMPLREPSQVLLGLLELLIQTGQKNGFLSDVLTGDVEMQNVPATTMMASVEQSTRGFKPVIEKVYISLQQEFKRLFHLYAKHLDKAQYINFQQSSIQITKDDFNEKEMNIMPVADPTLSSEAQGYAQARALIEGSQAFPTCTNMQEAALRFYTQLQFDDPEKLVASPPPPQPNPEVMNIQLEAQIAQQKQQLGMMAAQLENAKLDNERVKTAMKIQEVNIKQGESSAKIEKMKADAQKEFVQARIAHQQANTAEKSVNVQAAKVHVMNKQVDNEKDFNNDQGNLDD